MDNFTGFIFQGLLMGGGQFTKKDGTIVDYISVFGNDDTYKIYGVKQGSKKQFEQITLPVNVRTYNNKLYLDAVRD